MTCDMLIRGERVGCRPPVIKVIPHRPAETKNDKRRCTRTFYANGGTASANPYRQPFSRDLLNVFAERLPPTVTS